MPEAEAKRYELMDGELFVLPSPTPRHQTVVGNLSFAFGAFVQRHRMGKVYFAPLDVVLSDHDVLQPDVIFISEGRQGFITESNINGPPDLVVEVLSPSTQERDRTAKRTIYARYGVREYWLIDPETRTVEVLKADEPDFETVHVFPEGTAATSPVLQGLEVTVSSLFE